MEYNRLLKINSVLQLVPCSLLLDNVGRQSLNPHPGRIMGAWAPLLGFRSERDELDLANGVRIEREHPPEELPDTDAFGRHTDDSGAVTHYAMVRIDQFSIISGTGSLEQDNYEAHSAAIEETLTYLWLFRAGTVWVEAIRDTERPMSQGWDLVRRPRGPSAGPYELSEEDCGRFERFVAYTDPGY